MRKQLLTSSFLLLGVFGFAQAQTSVMPPVATVADSNSSIYNGTEHAAYPAFMEGQPYYSNTEWHKGSIVYRDELYTDVFLKYDLVRDEVILRHYNGYTGIVLFLPRVQSFSLGNNRFVTIPSENGTVEIYEEIVHGDMSLYAKRSKKIDETLTAAGVEKRVLTRNSYYVAKDGQLHYIKNENAVMNLVKEKKSQVKAQLKADGLRYRRNPEAALTTIVTTYNQSSR